MILYLVLENNFLIKKVKKKNYLNIVPRSKEIQYRTWHVSTGKVCLPFASCHPTADSTMFRQLTMCAHSTDDISTKAQQDVS